MKIAVVLAAGTSSRMGRPKLELPVGGAPMVRRVVETMLKAPFDRVRVVTAPGAAVGLPDDPRVEIVENPRAKEGIASSIRAGLTGLPETTEVVAIALGDMPLVATETVRELLRTYEETRRPIVFPQYRGRQGNPVLWDRGFLGALRELEGDRGAKALLERNRDLALAVPVEDPGVCLDIDTPADYADVVSPREAGKRKSVFVELEEAYERGEAVALVTILETRGSTPQKAGAKMVVGRDGRMRGTVGGGCVESEILFRAQRAIETRKCEIGTYDFNADEDENGLICGGSMKVFIEPILPPPRVYVVGAGHVAQPVAQVAKIAGFEVVVLDDRVKYASRERFPEADIVKAGPIPELASEFQYGDNAYVVIVTRGHKEDEEALRTFIGKDTAYIGLIGSVTKLEKIVKRLARDGVPKERIERVHSPIGLDLGGSSPGEIAVSIVAELLAVRYQRTGKPMTFTERQEYFGRV
jgi:xanthine dehydrogenase accessory factor